eukprot:g3627.t1
MSRYWSLQVTYRPHYHTITHYKQPNYVPKYVHQKHYVPVKEPSPPQYHSVPVPVPVKDPGQVIKVPVPLPPQTVVHNKVIYKTRHVKVQHIYDCNAGFNNWRPGQ